MNQIQIVKELQLRVCVCFVIGWVDANLTHVAFKINFEK